MITPELIASAATAALFASVFLAGRHIHPLRDFVRDQRSVISFGAGMSTAYVFVGVMPELHEARSSLAHVASVSLPYEGMVIYLMALIGFLTFYGLDHLRIRMKKNGSEGRPGLSFKVHLGGFATYVGLVSYLIWNGNQKTLESIGLYAVALSFHFLEIDHSMRDEYDQSYQRFGRFVLAGACLLGVSLGIFHHLRAGITAMALAFVSGSIIINSTITELASQRDAKFTWFAAGALMYGLILVPLG